MARHDRLARFGSFATSSSRTIAATSRSRTFRLGVEQPQIRDKMGHVVPVRNGSSGAVSATCGDCSMHQSRLSEGVPVVR